MISSGSLDIKHKIELLEKVKTVTVAKSLINMNQKAHFLQIYWREAQNEKLKRDFENLKIEFDEKIEKADSLHYLTHDFKSLFLGFIF